MVCLCPRFQSFVLLRPAIPQRLTEKTQPLSVRRLATSQQLNRDRAFFQTCVRSRIELHAGDSGERGDLFLEKLFSLWNKSPEPVREFPWKDAFQKSIQHMLRLILQAGKWLAIPVLLVSSLSEMIYCGLQDKEFLIPIGILAGILFANVLKNTAVELSPDLQNSEIPWHLIFIASIFVLIKLPGPYYPFWGRLFLPHFANGGLLRVIWLARKVKHSRK